MQYKYKISVIMPVYNSALYIGEAIESVVAQTIGIENIQLIIVNDGSTDNSAKIIKSYKERYPESITCLEKENGGVASARNEALKHIEGKYTAFLDPDDTAKPNTYKDIFDFFEQNYEKTDAVSYPITLFGSIQGEHPLNSKFEGESRVLNLLETGDFQLHITSSVIKSEIAAKMHFKDLAASEDAEALLRILIDTPRLGIVNTARYNYRKHEVSLIGTAAQKRGWYFDHLDGYFESVIAYARSKYQSIPLFVQNAIMYDLSWKLSQRKRPDCLNEQEAYAFTQRLCECVSCLDDSVIMSATELNEATKYYLLINKYKLTSGTTFEKTDEELTCGTIKMSNYPYILEFIDTTPCEIVISVRVTAPVGSPEITRVLAFVNGTAVVGTTVAYETKVTFLGAPIVESIISEISIPKSLFTPSATVYFAFEAENTRIISNNIELGKFFPIEQKYKTAFTTCDEYIVSHDENSLIVEPSKPKMLKKRRHVFEKEIWQSNGFAERKAVIARALARLYKRFVKKPIWIISDRLSRAGDNGEALFNYLNKTKFKSAKYIYAINRGSDFSRLKKQGRVVDRASLKYKIIHLASDIIISSQAEDFVLNPFDYYGQPYKDILSKKKFVFLQHGVIKDDLSAWLNKYNKNIKGFVTSARAEYDSILNESKYHYTEKELWLTGLPRFDRLEGKDTKFIALMPTWRRYLAGGIDISNGKWRASERLENSEYVKFWNALINDPRLAKALSSHGYEMLLVPHPNMQSMCDFIDTPPYVSVINDADYNHIYSISRLVITDYSSAVFDFAYLERPIIYAQFDKDEFFSGIHSYEKGYFDYERDGFGKVVYTLDETVESVIQCIENDCRIAPLYLERIGKFFAYRDKGSCERVVKALLELQNEKTGEKK